MLKNKRILILYGILLVFPLWVWPGFNNLERLVFFVSNAHSAGETDDQSAAGVHEPTQGGSILFPKKRKELFPKIKKLTKFKIISIPPKEIDEAVLSPGHMNLNWLEAIKTIEIIS